MNEHDYNVIEVSSIIACVCIVSQFVLTSAVLNIPISNVGMSFITVIGIISLLIAIVSHYKKQMFILEMKREIEKHKGDRNGLDGDTIP